jgi:hypothetical protein
MPAKEGQQGQLAEERRRYFRVDDVLPVLVRKVTGDLHCLKARVFQGLVCAVPANIPGEELLDDTIPPGLMRLLLNINAKLDFVIDHLFLQAEGVAKAESRRVSLSAAGLGVHCGEPFALGDTMEVKLMLPLNAPVWVLLYGQVSRCSPVECGGHDLAVDFFDMDEEVRSVLNQYTLKRQREIIRKEKGYGQW